MAEYRDAKTFVVSWMNFHNNSMHMQQVEALHEWHAMQESDQDVVADRQFHTCTTIEDLQDAAFKRGGLIAVLEIKPE